MSNTKKKSCRKPLSKSSGKRAKFITHTGPARNFVAMIPLKLEEAISDWQPEWPETLKEFPRNILFANSGELRGVLYEPDFRLFMDRSATVKLTYRTVMPSDFCVIVEINKISGAVETRKYDGDQLIRLSHGPDVKGAMMMTTMSGVDPNEPATIGVRVCRDAEELRSCIADRWPPPPERRVRERLVYGVLHKTLGNKNLVFIPQRQAHRLAAIYTAIIEAATWQSFCDRMPLDDLWYLGRDMRNRGIELPSPAGDFDARWLPPAYYDHDWPEWAEQMMFDWLPEGICSEYGKCISSPFNGFFLNLDVSREEEIVRSLEQEGFQCEHDERLVRRACGYGVAE